MPWWKSIAREPLIHFALIGAALFAIDDAREPPARPAPAAATPAPVAPTVLPTAPAAPRAIVIDADARKQIAANAERRLGRAPTDTEIAAETERWIDEEVLYREAIARGLDRADPVIHERIAGRMSYVLEQATIVPEPSEAELRKWFEQHRDKWSVPEHVDFTHVFIAGNDAAANARADEIAAALAAGAAPERLGDRFSGGHRYRGRKPADLALAFGDEFVDGLAKQPIGTWVRRRSRHGLHLVRVDRVDAAAGADFATARLDVRKEWLEARRLDEMRAALKRLRDGWTIERR
ncbi:MAG TPA: peptidyl-prolyl cis-trans isomerase [Kofleriaceae bacterium]